MLIDKSLEIADATAVNAAAGTACLATSLDLGAAGTRPFGNRNMYFVIEVAAAFTSGGSATVQFQLVTDSTDPASTDGSATVHWASRVFPIAELPLRRRIIVPLPGGTTPAWERYLSLLVVTAVATTTAGSINAYLTMDPPQDWKAYAEGTN